MHYIDDATPKFHVLKLVPAMFDVVELEPGEAHLQAVALTKVLEKYSSLGEAAVCDVALIECRSQCLKCGFSA